MKYFLSLIVILSVSPLVWGQDLYPRNSSIDVLQYNFEIELNDDNDTIYGRTLIYFDCLQPTPGLSLDFYATDQEGGMRVLEIKDSTGKSLSFNHLGEKLIINENWTLGKHQVQVVYKGIPKDGLIISKNKHGQRTFFCDNWPNRAHHYIPVIDHPYEKAKSSFRITAPSYYQVVSNGVEIESTDKDGNLRVTQWESTQPLPTKVLVFGAARFAKNRAGEVLRDSVSIPVFSWVYPQERDKGFYDYAACVDILQWFQEKIAPYPYAQLSNVQSKTRYGGMENAGCIFYHENSIDGKRGSKALFAHEIAHQWFGNSASEADWHHVWLSEGFATYLTEVYKQENISEAAFRRGMKNAAKRVAHFQSIKPHASIIDTNISDLNQLLNPCTYQKAAWMLHGLRVYVGDSVFWQGVRSYYNTYQFSNAYSSDFIQVMERISGKNLKPYFWAWLYQPGMPEFSFRIKSDKVVVKQETAFFPVFLTIEVKYKNGTSEEFAKPMNESSISFPVSGKDVAQVIIDPHGDILKK